MSLTEICSTENLRIKGQKSVIFFSKFSLYDKNMSERREFK